MTAESYCVLRLLAYRLGADVVDEAVLMEESTALQGFQCFINSVLEFFDDVYLRKQTEDDLRHILASSERRFFPGMIGSIDCCKWERKNYPLNDKDSTRKNKEAYGYTGGHSG